MSSVFRFEAQVHHFSKSAILRNCGYAIVVLLVAFCAGWSGAKTADYGTPVKVLPFSRPGSVMEMATVDLNGDGYDDVIVAWFYYPLQDAAIPIQILLNDTHGGFTDGTSQLISGNVPTTVMPRRIVVADFNNDGRPDIFIADHGYDAPPYPGGQSRLLLSTPDGHYVDSSGNLPQQLAFTHSATAADIDGSGHVALYLGNIGRQPPQLLLNDGSGHFTISSGRLPSAQTDLSVNTYVSSQFVDVNGDSCPDLVLGSDQGNQSQVLLNNCSGYFSVLGGALPAKLFGDGITLHVQPFNVSSSALPGLFLVSTHGNPFYEGRAIQVLINNGDGSFRDESVQRLNFKEDTGRWIKYIRLADISGQCRADVFPEINGSSEIRLYLDDGQQHFSLKNSDLPNVFGTPIPVRMFAFGRVSFLSTGGDGFYLVPATSAVQCPSPGAARAPHDFNGDGKSDIVWRNTSGEAGIWFMNGGTISSAPTLGIVPNNWSIVGQRDISGDGKADLLWLNSVGDFGTWFMNGAAVSSAPIAGNVGMAWSVVGTGDFNGDGKSDILWRNTNGDLGIWFSTGSTYNPVGLGNVPPNWSVIGTADFNGDGKRDILWRNNTNDVGIWFMNGSTVTSAPILANVGASWTVAGTGDFDGDGKADILWRSASNDIGIWLMNGPSIVSAPLAGNVGRNMGCRERRRLQR